jgi:hypothetical protein
MSRLTLALLLTTIAVAGFPRIGGATNYHEYKKFDVSSPTERAPSRCHAQLKHHRNYHYDCHKWWEFPYHD